MMIPVDKYIKSILKVYLPYILFFTVINIYFRHVSGGDIAIVASAVISFIIYLMIWLLIYYSSPIKDKFILLLILISLGGFLYLYLKSFVY